MKLRRTIFLCGVVLLLAAIPSLLTATLWRDSTEYGWRAILQMTAPSLSFACAGLVLLALIRPTPRSRLARRATYLLAGVVVVMGAATLPLGFGSNLFDLLLLLGFSFALIALAAFTSAERRLAGHLIGTSSAIAVGALGLSGVVFSWLSLRSYDGGIWHPGLTCLLFLSLGLGLVCVARVQADETASVRKPTSLESSLPVVTGLCAGLLALCALLIFGWWSSESERLPATQELAAVRAARPHFVALALSGGGLGIVALLGVLHVLLARDSAARERSEAELHRRNETLRNFAHTIAHDLRAPLRGIAGYATELEGYADQVDARGRHCITHINVAAQNLERLIGDTLDYAQLDAETPQLTTVELPQLVASLLQQRAPELLRHGTQVDTHFGIVAVTSWERGLSQIIGNLLDNAIKYSRHAQPPRVRIETAQTPLSWRFAIYDNGIGFDMKYHDRIFGLFQRLVTTEEFEGAGAGLAIVRKITDRLGGTVCAEGRPGGGATFLVELPRVVSSGRT